MIIDGVYLHPSRKKKTESNNSNSAPEHATDEIQKPADRAKKIKTSTFQFQFHCRVIAKYVLVKTEEAILYYCPDGQMVKLSVSQAAPNCIRRFDSRLGQFTFFSPTAGNFFFTAS